MVIRCDEKIAVLCDYFYYYVNNGIRFYANMSILINGITAVSIKVVPKTREKVEYERERLIHTYLHKNVFKHVSPNIFR